MKHNEVTMAQFRYTTIEHLRALTEPEVVTSRSKPVFVVVPYDLYVYWQKQLAEAAK